MTYIINSGWRGNKNIKPFGHSITYTKEQLEEYLKCSQDIFYFIENYCKIISLDHGLVKFEMYDYQKRFIAALHKERRIISLMPRQSGKCVSPNTKVSLRNKITNEVINVTLGEFYAWQWFKKNGKIEDMRTLQD